LKIAKSDQLDLQKLCESEGVCEGEFIKRRERIMGRLRSDHKKDFRKSQNAKRSWKNNKRELSKGINRYHKSTAGKLMHRKLTRFNSENRGAHESLEDISEAIVALGSLRTHLVLEDSYCIPDFSTQVQIMQLREECCPRIDEAINNLENGQPINEDTLQMIEDLTVK